MVLILPMRDWNPRWRHPGNDKRWFWSYLWGIETIRSFAIYNQTTSSFWSYLWGIETKVKSVTVRPAEKFWSYLWGIETRISQVNISKKLGFDLTYEGLKRRNCLVCYGVGFEFWSYLWGIETREVKRMDFLDRVFWSYLWGIETQKTPERFNSTVQVLILPMRDWNHWKKFQALLTHLRFDLTYEGLKLVSAIVLAAAKEVLILPMRDWNWFGKQRISEVASFWSYLWGIETRFRCPHLSSSNSVLILPMRDWNQMMKWMKGTRWISFWSYLWGIETRSSADFRRWGVCFDLTYEGLKPDINNLIA